jgi:1-acyl-sn-glycerol-3-phosphate acyltransferase
MQLEMDFWYRISKQIVGTYLAAFIKRIHVIGEENLRPGPKIIMPNHRNLTDGFTLPFVIKEKLHFLIQSDAFDIPILRFLLTKAGQIPVAKGRGEQALSTALDFLSAGKSIVVFPEGRLNHGEELHRGKLGAALMAKLSGAPILPVGFFVPPENVRMFTTRIQDRISKACIQIRGACYLNIGQPWSVAQSKAGEFNPYGLRDLTKKIMGQIEDLVGQAKMLAQGS